MTTDTKIREAIEASVADAGQARTLAKKLVRWFDAVASGNEEINDPKMTDRHLELLYAETRTENDSHKSDPWDDNTARGHEEKAP